MSTYTLSDLIELGLQYDPDIDNETSLKCKMFNIIPALIELDSLVGMQKIKSELISHIIYHVQGFHNNDPDGNMMHMTIEAPPGCGKTVIAQIIAKIYSKLGFLSEHNKITFAKRIDFIGEYVGHTVSKTTKLLKSAKGGVLVIDEVYSLGQKDTFSKEAIDALNQYLSENKDDLICIVMGYPKDVEEYFFNTNRGLSRRFPYRYTIESYTPEELFKIFEYQVINNNYNFENVEEIKNFLIDFFTQHKTKITENGGDTEFLLTVSKIQRAHNIFDISDTLTSNKKYMLSLNEIKTATEKLLNHKSKIDQNPNKYLSIYL